MTPLVSVILPFYNAQKYLDQAISSIVQQDYPNWELILINDHSTDQSLKIAESWSKKSVKISLYNNLNKGLVSALNHGISLSNGEYIARMDADDISLPGRISQQVNFFENHSQIQLCGSAISIIQDSGRVVIKRFLRAKSPISCSYINLWTSPLTHPAVMMRKKIFNDFSYSNEDNHFKIEDHQLWSEIILAGWKIANSPDVLLKYRIHKDSVSLSKDDIQRSNSIDHTRWYWNNYMDTNITFREAAIITNKWKIIPTRAEIKSSFLLLQQYTQCFTNKNQIETQEMDELRILRLDHEMDIFIRIISKGKNIWIVKDFVRWFIKNKFPFYMLFKKLILKYKLRYLSSE